MSLRFNSASRSRAQNRSDCDLKKSLFCSIFSWSSCSWESCWWLGSHEVESNIPYNLSAIRWQVDPLIGENKPFLPHYLGLLFFCGGRMEPFDPEGGSRRTTLDPIGASSSCARVSEPSVIRQLWLVRVNRAQIVLDLSMSVQRAGSSQLLV